MLDKTHLRSAFSGDSWGTDGPAAYRARIVLFIGVALMAGGLAGSLVSPACLLWGMLLMARLS